jgi:hypothetical protein
MAMPYVCAKCGASFPAGAGLKCDFCGSDLEIRQDGKWPWLAVQEWFILVAAIAAGVAAFINS